MSPKHDADQRFVDLEVKLSFLEDHLETLDALVAEQRRQIEVLVREVVQLRRETPSGDGGARNLRDELPPHY